MYIIDFHVRQSMLDLTFNMSLFFYRKSLRTLWVLQSWTSRDTWWKTDTKPSCRVSNSLIRSPQQEARQILFSLLCSGSCTDPESRVILRSPDEENGTDHYINANYIRVRVWHYFTQSSWPDTEISRCLYNHNLFWHYSKTTDLVNYFILSNKVRKTFIISCTVTVYYCMFIWGLVVSVATESCRIKSHNILKTVYCNLYIEAVEFSLFLYSFV